MKSLFTFLFCFFALNFLGAQSNFWTAISEERIMLPPSAAPTLYATSYQTLALDYEALAQSLQGAPLAFTPEAKVQPAEVILPLPDGRMEAFEVVESRIMAPELAAKYPHIKAFTAISKERPLVTARFEVTPKGFTGGIHTPEGRVYIAPYATQQTRYYHIYYKRHERAADSQPLTCGYDELTQDELTADDQHEQRSLEELAFRGPDAESVPLRTYRMALVCTGEFAQTFGGTMDDVMSAYAISLNRLNEILQLEMAVTMELIPNNDDLIHLNPGTDPFNTANVGGSLLGQNQAFLNGAIGLGSYDIGHIFTGGCTDVGGVVSGGVCTSGKGRGVTCFSSSNIFSIVTRILSHEVGHQFAAGHSFNNCPGSLDQLSAGNAFEPGSGSTIMSYNGACGNQNIGGGLAEYYNIGSLEDFIGYARVGTGSTCGSELLTANHFPEIQMDYEDGFWIPSSTPFELSADATDEDGDALTYIWEQYDTGPVSDMGDPSDNAPLFRSFPPSSGGKKRVFPRLNKILNNNFDNTEVLPTYDRDMTFQFVVRDNNPDVGGVVWEKVAFKADGNSGPFEVLSPNEAQAVWRGGEYREVTWNVANTTNNRVNCQYIDILLSVDGGSSFPYVLLEDTPNDGSAFVDVPDVPTDEARIRIQASDNIFFDINNADFLIEAATEPGYAMSLAPATFPLVCLPSEPLDIEINTNAILDYDTTLMLSLVGELPAGTSASFASDTLPVGESTTLTLDLAPSQGRDTLNLLVQAMVPGADTALRELRVIMLNSDYTQVALLSPPNGQSGIVFSTDFSWQDVPDADEYSLRIATSPSFAEETLLESVFGITETTDYTPDNLFEQDQLYFWSVRPENDCGPGEYLPPFAFRTSTVDCVNNLPDDLPVNLSNNPSVRTSKLFITDEGVISDINIDDLEIVYSPVSVLRVSVISPAGTKVVLFDQSCLSTGLLRASFDDEAPNPIGCPPITTLPVQPEEPLAAFIGENTFGEWTLEVEVVSSGFGGGTLTKWGLEFCAAVTPSAPIIITNEVLGVPPGAGNTITADKLEVQDENATAQQLEYTIITLPQHGQLFRGTEPLGVGDEFTQETIDLFNLTYVHDGSDTEVDSFTFIVEDQEGGWIPTQTFSIQIDEDATVSTANLPLDQTLKVFPNPARDHLNITFGQPVNGTVALSLFNLQGQRLLRQERQTVNGGITLPVSELPKGVYALQLQTEQGIVSRKIAIQ